MCCLVDSRREGAIGARADGTQPQTSDARLRIEMIVLMHVTTGALAGAAVGSRGRAALPGPLVHFVCDVIPHEDIPSRRFETASGVAAVLLLARRPDLEDILPLPRPRGLPLFPSHRWARPVSFPGVPAWLQLAVAAPTVVALARRS
jgi:hypothetical protein